MEKMVELSLRIGLVWRALTSYENHATAEKRKDFIQLHWETDDVWEKIGPMKNPECCQKILFFGFNYQKR